MEKIVEKELSYSIIGALFDVYNEIGFGHKERMYQKALTVMLKKRNVAFKEQVKVDVVLHNEVIGKYFLDFFVEGRIIDLSYAAAQQLGIDGVADVQVEIWSEAGVI